MDGEPQKQKSSKHICMTVRGPLTISEDPVMDIIAALHDEDVMKMVRGLAREEIRSPYSDGAFGEDENWVSSTLRKMKDGGLVMSRRDGPDHVYYLNRSRFMTLEKFIQDLFRDESS